MEVAMSLLMVGQPDLAGDAYSMGTFNKSTTYHSVTGASRVGPRHSAPVDESCSLYTRVDVRKLGSVLQRAFYGSGGCVTLYELRNFSGRRLAVTSDCPKLSECNFPERCNSVQVESGAWVGYEGENYSGRQYLWDVYDKREYSNYDKWLGTSDHISSVRAVREECSPSKICLYEKPGFSGRKVELQEDIPNLISRFSLNRFASARVLGGVWVVYQDPNYRGLHYILEKRDFNNCTEWGATAATVGSIRRIRFH